MNGPPNAGLGYPSFDGNTPPAWLIQRTRRVDAVQAGRGHSTTGDATTPRSGAYQPTPVVTATRYAMPGGSAHAGLPRPAAPTGAAQTGPPARL